MMSAVASDIPAVPATTPSPVSEDADSSSNVDWAKLTSDLTTDSSDFEPPPPHPPAIPPTPQKAEVPIVPPVVEPPPPAQEVQLQKAPETAPPPVVEAETKTEIPPITPPPEIKVDDFAKLQADYVEKASKQYELTEEQAIQLSTDPNKVLPKLAGQLEANVVQTVLQSLTQVLQQILPQYIEHHTSVRETTTKAEQAFFGKWEELKPHKERVMEVGRIYRQMKPQATADEFIRDVGMQVWMAMGLPPEKMAAKILARPPPAPVTPKPLEGFSPANPGARTVGMTPTPSNPFTDLTQEILTSFNNE